MDERELDAYLGLVEFGIHSLKKNGWTALALKKMNLNMIMKVSTNMHGATAVLFKT
jgi:hypothetical protein